jgi:predicted flap endonuclease-1-like 5' DNA nuclease
VRPASRLVQLLALVVAALSVGWLLLRRRIRPAPALRAVPDLPRAATPRSRAAWPAEAEPDTGSAGPGSAGPGSAEAGSAEAGSTGPGSAEAGSAGPGSGGGPALSVEPRRPEPLSALGRLVHDTAGAPGGAPDQAPAVSPAPGPAADPDPDPPPPPAAAAAAPLPSAAPLPPPEPASGTGHDAEQTDDLQRIRGVGPAIESVLHGLGIRSYRQLVALDEAGLDRVRDALRDFRQRIEREDWIGQSRRLHREKYGEEA